MTVTDFARSFHDRLRFLAFERPKSYSATSRRLELQRGKAAVASETAPGKQLRAAISVFFDLVEDDPCAARVLLIGSQAPAPIADICRRIQAAATISIAQIMHSHSSSRAGDSDKQWFLKAEFTKKGMHGLAEWWLDHANVPRSEIDEALFSILEKGVGLT